MRLINEDDVLEIIERVTNEAVEKKQPKYLIQPRIIAEISGLPTIEAEPVNGWISVKDRLPEYNQKVFVVYNDVDPTGVSIRRLIIAELAVDGYWMEGCTWHPDTSITHWRYLPQPPKEDNDG